MNECLTAALKYESMGYSVIPCNPSEEEEKGKKPFIKWERYQKERAAPDQIKEWWTKWPAAMIGIVTGEISGLFVVDADSEEAKEKIETLIPESLEIPVVKTPRGWHYYFKYQPGIINSNNGILHVRGTGGFAIAPPSKRSNGNPYLWQSAISKSLSPAPPSLINNIINNALNIYRDVKKDTVTKVTSETSVTNYFQHLRRNDDLFHLAFSLIIGKAKDDFILQAMERIKNTFSSTDPIVSYIELKNILKSARERVERKDRNIAFEVETWINEVTSGYFSVTSLYSELQLLQKEEKTAARVALHRMLNKSITTGNKRGEYRIIENKAEEIDIFSDTDKPLNLNYPLGIESFVHTMPKSIIIIAGESDAGKTAFLLNFSSLNLDYYPITYFSSEMGPTELKDRISKFSRPVIDWKKISFKERGSNFQDVIEPDKINIIDYLELADDFYKVGGQIKAIFDKLNKGIALIALQKKIGSELARGGDFTMEKARLYITLSRDNICKIIKAKNWVNSMVKPTGKQRKYILLHGCEFRTKSNWEMEGQEDE